jgi:hypothetical protein
MTLAHSKYLLARLNADEQFRNKVLSTNDVTESEEIILAEGYGCTKDEIELVLRRFFEEQSRDTGNYFSLWGTCGEEKIHTNHSASRDPEVAVLTLIEKIFRELKKN